MMRTTLLLDGFALIGLLLTNEGFPSFTIHKMYKMPNSQRVVDARVVRAPSSDGVLVSSLTIQINLAIQ
jgi:hypothetical protein